MKKSVEAIGKRFRLGTVVCCGFNDYSTFFRAYKKQFGANPKVHMS